MKLINGRPHYARLMGKVAALFLASLPLQAPGMALLGNATRGFLTPSGAAGATDGAQTSSNPDHGSCNCEDCVSAHRRKPTVVSDTKCVPGVSIPMGLTCNPRGKFPARTHDKDVPYQLFCMCSCQPFLTVESAYSATSEPPPCIDFSAEEHKLVDHPDGERDQNCEDPKFPTQMSQNKGGSAKDWAKMSKEAGTPPPLPAPPDLTKYTRKVLENGNETKRQMEAASLAHETAEMLTHNPIFDKLRKLAAR